MKHDWNTNETWYYSNTIKSGLIKHITKTLMPQNKEVLLAVGANHIQSILKLKYSRYKICVRVSRAYNPVSFAC